MTRHDKWAGNSKLTCISGSKLDTAIDDFWGNSAQHAGVAKVRQIPHSATCNGAAIQGIRCKVPRFSRMFITMGGNTATIFFNQIIQKNLIYLWTNYLTHCMLCCDVESIDSKYNSTFYKQQSQHILWELKDWKYNFYERSEITNRGSFILYALGNTSKGTDKRS